MWNFMTVTKQNPCVTIEVAWFVQHAFANIIVVEASLSKEDIGYNWWLSLDLDCSHREEIHVWHVINTDALASGLCVLV